MSDILLHNAARIMAAEAERVAQSARTGALALVKGEVEVVVDLGIVVAFFVA